MSPYACLALLALAIGKQNSGDLVFAPVADSSSTKIFRVEHDLAVQKMEMEGSQMGMMSQRRLDLTSSIDLKVTDQYRKVDGGRPSEMRRLYDSSGFHIDFVRTDPQGVEKKEAWDAETPLKGKSVVFTWIPEEKSYSRYYDQAETLEEYLASLSQDLDFVGLLPGRPVHQGESWSIDSARLVDLFVPGGDVPMGYVKGGGSGLGVAIAAGVGGPLYPVFGGTIKGDCKATWKENREADGLRLAVVELAFKVETDRDRTEAARRLFKQDEDAQESSVRHAGVQWKFEGSGTLLWNLDANRFEKIDVVGREDVTSDIQLGRGDQTSRQLLSMAGSLKLSGKIAPKKK